MVRRQFKEQVRIVAEGGDPVGVSFDDAKVDTIIAGNYIIDDDTDLSEIPLAETLESLDAKAIQAPLG